MKHNPRMPSHAFVTAFLFGGTLLLPGCATKDLPERAEEISCPTGEIACIRRAQQKCPDHRILIFDNHRTLTEVSELPPGAPISEGTIMKRPVVIVCEKLAS